MVILFFYGKAPNGWLALSRACMVCTLFVALLPVIDYFKNDYIGPVEPISIMIILVASSMITYTIGNRSASKE